MTEDEARPAVPPVPDTPDASPAPGPVALPVARRLPAFFWVLLVISVGLLATGVWLFSQSRAAAAGGALPTCIRPGRPAADFQLTALDGSKVRLADLKGKVVLLNFWATWCPPCQAETADLAALHKENAAEHNFVVIGVDYDESQAVVEKFARANGVTYPLLLDTNGTVTEQTYLVHTLPVSIIIDRQGVIRDSWMGQQPKDAMLRRLGRVW